MDLTATVYRFDISLSDVDRAVYENLDLRLAPHQLETPSYLLTRMLAYCLEYREGIEMARGMFDTREPDLWVRDLTGRVTHWIEVGTPNAKGLHKASKAADHVIIYSYDDPGLLKSQLAKQKIYRAKDIQLYSLDPVFLKELESVMDRRTIIDLYICSREIFVTTAGRSFSSRLIEHQLK
jgi:uncharacterized protein YaeQ